MVSVIHLLISVFNVHIPQGEAYNRIAELHVKILFWNCFTTIILWSKGISFLSAYRKSEE